MHVCKLVVADPETSVRGPGQETRNIDQRVRRPSFCDYYLQHGGRMEGGGAPLISATVLFLLLY